MRICKWQHPQCGSIMTRTIEDLCDRSRHMRLRYFIITTPPPPPPPPPAQHTHTHTHKQSNINTLRPRQNCRHLTDDVENVSIRWRHHVSEFCGAGWTLRQPAPWSRGSTCAPHGECMFYSHKYDLIVIKTQKTNTLRPGENGRHFADDIFKCIFLNENVWIPIEISLKFVTTGPIDNIPVLV